MKQGAGRCLAVLVLAFLAVILIAAPPEHRAEAQDPNTPATGEVIVTGTARVGETLTADASSIADADGLSDRNFTLVWMAGATSNPSEATRRIFSNGERYHVDPSDAGLMVMVAAKFFDDAGNAEVVVSAPTAVVAPTAPGPPVNLTASSKPHGNLSVRWLSPFWRIEDWLADRPSLGDGGSDITGYKVQWKLSTGSWTVPADVSEGTTTEETHTITNLTGGQTYTLRVIATNAIGDSQPSGEITRAINRFPTGIPTLTGTPRVGEVLTIGTSGITDEDGLTNPGFSRDPPKESARAAAVECSAVAGTMVLYESRTSHREHPFDASSEQPRPDRHRLRRRPPGGRCGAAPPGHARPASRFARARRQLRRPR